MKFLRNKRADHSLRDAQYGHLVGKILGDRELVGLLTAVLGYRYGTKTGRVPRGEQHRREIVTCWSRKCEQMEICPTLLKLLKTRYPGKKLEMLGACDFKCVLVDGKPVESSFEAIQEALAAAK